MYLAMKGSCWGMDLNGDQFYEGPQFPEIRELFGDGTRGLYFSLYAEAGFSIYSHQDELLIGTPGAYDWSGSFLSISDKETVFGNLKYYENNEVTKSDFSGYSIAVGNFKGTKYVLGAPRGGYKRQGQVVIVSLEKENSRIPGVKDAIIHQQFIGNQTGEYFGSALLVTDLNNDGLDDLIVGSPLYSTQSYEEGGITVFTSKAEGSLTQVNKISPNIQGNTGGRFGISIASIGDLTGDGIAEIAIGAPGSSNGRGAVFIYSGYDLLLSGDPIQIIQASDFRFGLEGFGSVVSSGTDIDKNLLFDLIIGAPKSENAIILRSQPALTFEASLEFEPKILTALTQDDFSLKLCYKFVSRKLLSSLSPISCELRVSSDKNIIFKQNNRNEIILRESISETNSCTTIAMEAAESFSFTRPSKVYLEINKLDDENVNSFCKSCGVIDPQSRKRWSESIEFQKDCKNQVCISNLKIEPNLSDDADGQFVIGRFSTLQLQITVANLDGEPAYRPRLELVYPREVALVKDVPNCVHKSAERSIVCNIFPSPITIGSNNIRTDFHFSAVKLYAGIEIISFRGQVQSESEELNQEDNKFILNQGLNSEVSLSLVSREPVEKVFRIENQVTDINFDQTIQIKNTGSSAVNRAAVNLLIPYGFYQDNQKVIILKNIQVRNAADTDSSSNPTSCKESEFQARQPEGDMSLSLNCGIPGTLCKSVVCSPLYVDNKRFSPELLITGVLIEEELKQLNLFSISTLAELKVIGGPSEWIENGTRNYTTIFVSKDRSSTLSAGTVIVISVLSALVFVVILTIILWRCGCFRSKKEEIEQMRQDEAAAQEFNSHNQKQAVNEEDEINRPPSQVHEREPMLKNKSTSPSSPNNV